MNLFPELKTPYFIYAPPWSHESSGVRALHLLCHALNESGQRAYLIPVNSWYATNPALNTPVMNDEHLAYYDLKGIEPIAVYPEIVMDNPFRLKKVVRWLLAPAGAYGGPAKYPEEDKVYGYTRDVADKYGTEKVLCLPTFDTTVFYPPEEGAKRVGDCFYSYKYDKIFGNKLPEETRTMTRCAGEWDIVADILRNYEKCYVYEMSEIMVNAALCGCDVIPVGVDLPGAFFNTDGRLVPQKVLLENFEWQLKLFIEESQRW